MRCKQANQILTVNAILLSTDELNALIERYGNELGFNYGRFLEDADPAEYAIPKLIQPSTPAGDCKFKNDDGTEKETEEDIIKILTKAKRQAVTLNLPVLDFLQDYDRHREGEILEVDFRRAVDNANIKMTPEEMDIICRMYEITTLLPPLSSFNSHHLSFFMLDFFSLIILDLVSVLRNVVVVSCTAAFAMLLMRSLFKWSRSLVIVWLLQCL